MCLNTIEKEGLDLSGRGWKVWEKQGEKLVFPCYGRREKVCRNRWLRAVPACVCYEVASFCWYNTGFHIAETREEARRFLKWLGVGSLTITPVKYRKGRIIGTQRIGGESSRVIVADEIKIPPRG